MFGANELPPLKKNFFGYGRYLLLSMRRSTRKGKTRSDSWAGAPLWVWLCMDRLRHLSVQGAKSFIQGPELSSEFPYVRDHYFLESLKEKSWIERPGKWSKGPCPKAAKPFPATWKRRACSGNSNGRLSFG